MARTPADRFFAALNQAYDTMIEAMEKGNQRGYRASRTMLRQARRGQRDLASLARKWSEAPTDVLGSYEALLDAQTRAQTRALELAREWLGEVGEARGELRDALQDMIRANRAAGQAIVEAAQGAFGQALSRVRGQGGAAEEQSAAAAESRSAAPVRRAPPRKAAGTRRRKAASRSGASPAG